MVSVPDGEYVLDQQLKIGSHTHLQLGTGAVLKRNFTQAIAIGTVVNANATNENIRVSGGTIQSNPGKNGKHLNFRDVSRLAIDGVRLLNVYNAWNTAFLDCDDVTISNVVIRGGTGIPEDGLHFAGGRRIAITNCLVDCGDDALSLLNEGPSIPLKPLEDVVVSNCYLYSRKVQALKIQVTPASGGWTPTAIRRISISNIVAKTGDGTGAGGGIFINGPAPGSDLVTDIEIDGFWLDASQNGGTPINIDNAKRVRLHHVVAWQPAVRAEIDGCADIELHDCVIDSPRTPAAQCLLVASVAACSNIRIVGGTYRAAKHDVIILGASSFAVTDFEVSGALIEGIGGASPTLVGLRLAKASGGLVSNNTIRNCTSWGIFEDPALASNNLFLGNRLFNNTLGPISFGGPNSQAIRNVAEAAREVADSGGFRQTIDGWYSLGIGANQSITDMSRAVGRFRAVRSGSITGIVLTTSQPRTGTSGSMTVTVYKNTGNAGAGGLTTSFSVAINTNVNRAAKTQAADATLPTRFLAGDELYLRIETSGWGVALPPTDVYCALEIED